ncbi:hypothetical protein RBB50_009812 [Rhinocladiella similis]
MHLALWPQRDPKGRLTREVVDAVENWGVHSPRIAEELLKCSSQKEAPVRSSLWRRGDEDTNYMRDKKVTLPTRPLEAPSRKLRSDASDKSKEAPDNTALERPPAPRPTRVFKRRASSMPPMKCTKFEEVTCSSSATDNGMDQGEVTKLAGRETDQKEAPSVASGTEMSSRIDDARTITSTHNHSDEHSGIRLRTLNNGKRLKRRTGPISSNQRKKQQHRGSIFDLAQDDGNIETREEQATTSVDRPKPSVANKFSPRKLYLPR